MDERDVNAEAASEAEVSDEADVEAEREVEVQTGGVNVDVESDTEEEGED